MNTITNYQQTDLIQEITPSFNHKLKRIRKEEDFRKVHQNKFELLTKREVEIVFLLAQDLNNPQIADELCISRHTVEQHRKNINRKLGISSYVQLFQYALAFNLV